MLREPYRFASYWESLKKSAGNIKRPIYMWDCFSPANVGIADLESYVDEIAFALNSCGVDHHEISLELEQLDIPDSEYDTYSAKVYSILYLVRCALISRLSGDINLTFRPEFNSPLGLDRFGRSYWEKLISVAERSLGRNPLNGDMGFNSCGKRITFEGGLPLRSLQGDITYVVEKACDWHVHTERVKAVCIMEDGMPHSERFFEGTLFFCEHTDLNRGKWE